MSVLQCFFKGVGFAALLGFALQAKGQEADLPALVRAFVEASNSRNADKMAEMVSESVEWLSINENTVSTETKGRDALLSYMKGYFASCPSCRSELVSISLAGTRVTAYEEASWLSKNGPRSQRALAVYEFEGGKIQRVYYFPAEA